MRLASRKYMTMHSDPEPLPVDRHPRGRLRRYREVVQVLARHGFDWLVLQLGLTRLAPLRWWLLRGRREVTFTTAEHMRRAMEELGVTFIKLGQILSTRSDILSPDYIEELSKLQEEVPPEPYRVVQGYVERELGRPPHELFAEFREEPVGSASIGQVHAARLVTGEDVVVKIQRPGLHALVEEDLGVMRDMARLAAGRTIWGQVYDLPGMVEEFANTLWGELDYMREGRNADRIRRSFANEPCLYVPTIYWGYTTRRVLVMERLRGIHIQDVDGLDVAGIDRKQLAETGVRVVLKMALEDGFFHADPHPGNFIVMENGVLGMMDFGMVGQVDDSTREGLLYLLLAIVNHDMDRVVDRLMDLGVIGNTVQLERLRRDLGHLLAEYWGLPLREIDISKVLDESMQVMRKHRLRVPTHLVLLAKTISMNEAIARGLDPDFSAAGVLEHYVPSLVAGRFSPENWKRELLPNLLDVGRLAVSLPRRADRLLTRFEHGNISVNISLQETDRLLRGLNNVTNRLILAMLASSFALAIALLLQIYYTGVQRWLLGWLLVGGMVVVSGLGLWLVANILRRNS
jgi:ubiquinone biosynthesis protein